MARDWGVQPSEFWEMSTQEFWWEFDAKVETHKRITDGSTMSSNSSGGFSGSEWSEARKQFSAKKRELELDGAA